MSRMYDEWQLFAELTDAEPVEVCALSSLTADAAREVARAVSQSLLASLNASSTEAICDGDDSEVHAVWCMHALSYGLTLSACDTAGNYDTLRRCTLICCTWLTALSPPDCASGVPLAVCASPHVHCVSLLRRMASVFGASATNTTAPRNEVETEDVLMRRAALCQRLLAAVAGVDEHHAAEQWPAIVTDALLLFHLRAADALLSPPSSSTATATDLGQLVGEQALAALFDAWLRACRRCGGRHFPPPQRWRALTDACCRWRHRDVLVSQWGRVITGLTTQLARHLFSIGDCTERLAGAERDLAWRRPALLAHCWYRLLHVLGGVAEMADARLVAGSQAFLRHAIVSPGVVQPWQHSCLRNMPTVFAACVSVLSRLVDTLMMTDTATPTSNVDTVRRASCNSVLRVFGAWLFEAAAVGTDIVVSGGDSCAGVVFHQQGSRRASAMLLTDHTNVRDDDVALSSITMTAANDDYDLMCDVPEWLRPIAFVDGRACAVAALCRVFCARRGGSEHVAPVYLAAFYRLLNETLVRSTSCLAAAVTSDRQTEETRSAAIMLSAVVTHGWRVLQSDLDGVNCLLPAVVDALQLMLSIDPCATAPTLTQCLQLARPFAVRFLVSAVAATLHFAALPLPRSPGDTVAASASVLADGACAGQRATFSALWPRLARLMLAALQDEQHGADCRLLLTVMWPTLLAMPYSPACTAGAPSSTPQQHQQQIDESISSEFNWRVVRVVSERLMTSWCGQLDTALTAIDLLMVLAGTSAVWQCESAAVVRCLCDFFSWQCGRPARSHSRLLHSSMVATLHCVAVWLAPTASNTSGGVLRRRQHSEATVRRVLQAVRLGVAGGGREGDSTCRPVSLRVRQAAETLLYVLLQRDTAGQRRNCHSQSTHVAPANYMVCGGPEDCRLLAVQQVKGSDDEWPRVELVARTPTLQSVWTLRPRHTAQTFVSSPLSATTSGSVVDVGAHTDTHTQTDKHDSVCQLLMHEPFQHSSSGGGDCTTGHAPGSMETTHIRLWRMMQRQHASTTVQASHLTPTQTLLSATPPAQPSNLHTARLLLRHLQLISGIRADNNINDDDDGEDYSASVLLNCKRSSQFDADLRALDSLGCRQRYVVVVRHSMCDSDSDGQSHLTRLLTQLGRQISSACVLDQKHAAEQTLRQQGSMFFWSDAFSELVFVRDRLQQNQHGCNLYHASVLLLWANSELDWQQCVSNTAAVTSGNISLVCVLRLRCGLYRLDMIDDCNVIAERYSCTSAVVVSGAVVASAVRQLVLCACRRRALRDTCHVAHVRRCQLIHQMQQRYRPHGEQGGRTHSACMFPELFCH